MTLSIHRKRPRSCSEYVLVVSRTRRPFYFTAGLRFGICWRLTFLHNLGTQFLGFRPLLLSSESLCTRGCVRNRRRCCARAKHPGSLNCSECYSRAPIPFLEMTLLSTECVGAKVSRVLNFSRRTMVCAHVRKCFILRNVLPLLEYTVA